MSTSSQTETLTHSEAAAGRRDLYALLSRLFLKGATPDLKPYLDAMPGLPAVPAAADDAAAEHTALFGFHLVAHASVFLDASGLLGGPVTERSAVDYLRAGFSPPDEPDHIGSQLAFLSFLLEAERAAWDAGDKVTATLQQQRQRYFLLNAVAPWLPPLIAALRMQPNRFYAAVADLTWQALDDHLAALPGATPPPPELPPPPALLDDPATGLKEIANFLTTPPHSGFWFGRSDIMRLGRTLDLPHGFGGRATLLTNLWRTAAQYEQGPALIDALRRFAAECDAAYAGLGDAGALGPAVTAWRQRTSATAAVIAGMAAQVGT